MTRDRFFLIIGAIIVLAATAVLVKRCLTSDEDRIAALLQDLAEDFSDRDREDVMAAFADDFRDQTSSLSKVDLRRYLSQLYFNRNYFRDREFLYALALDDADPQIQLDGERATVEADFTFRRLDAAGEWLDVWRVAATFDLRKIDGTWQITSSQYRELSGSRPF